MISAETVFGLVGKYDIASSPQKKHCQSFYNCAGSKRFESSEALCILIKCANVGGNKTKSPCNLNQRVVNQGGDYIQTIRKLCQSRPVTDDLVYLISIGKSLARHSNYIVISSSFNKYIALIVFCRLSEIFLSSLANIFCKFRLLSEIYDRTPVRQ